MATSPLADGALQHGVCTGIDDVEPRAQHGDGCTIHIQRAAMGAGIDAARQTTYDSCAGER